MLTDLALAGTLVSGEGRGGWGGGGEGVRGVWVSLTCLVPVCLPAETRCAMEDVLYP